MPGPHISVAPMVEFSLRVTDLNVCTAPGRSLFDVSCLEFSRKLQQLFAEFIRSGSACLNNLPDF